MIVTKNNMKRIDTNGKEKENDSNNNYEGTSNLIKTILETILNYVN